MKPVRQWDPKTVMFVAGFLGVTSIGGLLSQAQRLTGWLAWPTIEAAQGNALDSLRAWHAEDRRALDAMAAKIDTVASRQALVIATIEEMPGAAAAAKRRRAKKKAKEDFLSTHDLAIDRSVYRNTKGDRIP